MDDDFIATQREFNREAFGFAHGYVQGLVVVGYAAMFFLWDKAEGRLPPALWSGVGLLLCISVGTYLAWEVFGFLFRQRVLMRQAFAIDFVRIICQSSNCWHSAGTKKPARGRLIVSL